MPPTPKKMTLFETLSAANDFCMNISLLIASDTASKCKNYSEC